MKYSGFIDSILAEAAFAKKTNDASWLIGRLQAETDPIKRKLLSVVCNADFIKGMKREAGWLREQKGKLEDIAADIEDGIEEIEAEEVNDHMQSVNYRLAKAAYDDDEDEEEDYLDIVSGDLYEWLMEVGSNSLLDDFKPQQLKNVIKMKLKKEKNIPNDDTEMANWCRKNEDDIIETVARATGAYFMSREDFLKKQQEEEEAEENVVQ